MAKTYNIDQVKSTYKELTTLVQKDLDIQFEKSRIKGTDYATTYAVLMKECLTLAHDSATAGALVASQISLTEAKIKGADADVLLKEEQILLTKRQREGFDDDLRRKMLEMQLNSWAMMKSSGMLDSIPKVITDDELSKLYDKMKAKVMATLESTIVAIANIENASATIGGTVTVNSTGSKEVSGKTISYEWEVKGPDLSTAHMADRLAATTSFVADIAGTYTVTVTITDSDGNRNYDSSNINVQ